MSMSVNTDCIGIILKYLPTPKLFPSLTTNKLLQLTTIRELKSRIVNVGKNKELAILLSKQGFKVKLDLNYTRVIDVSALGKVHTLNLWGTLVTDVSALGGVHTLHLGFTEVTDVSALGGVHTLHLRYTKVTQKDINYLKSKGVKVNF